MVCNLYRNKVVSENQLDKSDLEFCIKLNPTASGHLRQIQRQSKHQRPTQAKQSNHSSRQPT